MRIVSTPPKILFTYWLYFLRSSTKNVVYKWQPTLNCKKALNDTHTIHKNNNNVRKNSAKMSMRFQAKMSSFNGTLKPYSIRHFINFFLYFGTQRKKFRTINEIIWNRANNKFWKKKFKTLVEYDKSEESFESAMR